jgi:hypothetical protein
MKFYKTPDVKNSPHLVKKRHQFGENAYALCAMRMNADKRLSASDVRVANAIAYHCFQGTISRISYADIAQGAAVSKRQVVRSVATLIAYGYLEKAEGSEERTLQWLVMTSPTEGSIGSV